MFGLCKRKNRKIETPLLTAFEDPCSEVCLVSSPYFRDISLYLYEIQLGEMKCVKTEYPENLMSWQ